MTAFGKLIRTTAFRLTLAYLFLFALFAASLARLFRLEYAPADHRADHHHGERRNQRDQRHLYAAADCGDCVFTIGNRALRPGANLYLVTTPTGQALGGNVGSLAPGVMATIGLVGDRLPPA